MSEQRPTLVIGSHNRKKSAEISELLDPIGVLVKSLADFADAPEVTEDGTTFAENARLKAAGYARHTGQWVLADDSGIEIDALDGAPGVYSARFAGPEADDDANNRLLLEKLGGAAPEKRGARYVCAIAIADPSGEIRGESRGKCSGRIVISPRGRAGFGYDPLFELREYHRTFGELGPSVKRAISHRSRALRAAVPLLAKLLF